MSAVDQQAAIDDRAEQSPLTRPQGSSRDVGRDVGRDAERDSGWPQLREAPAPTAREVLTRAIQNDVVPRLLLARGGLTAPSVEAPLSAADVSTFAELTLAQDGAIALSFVETMRDRGLPLETLYLQLLAPAARHLGELWAQDLCDFGRVTIGLGRMQRVMHDLSPIFLNERASRPIGKRALLMAAPGEQHTFGLTMVAEFFRRAGWLVRCSPKFTTSDLVESLRRDSFDVVGVSLSGETHLEDVSTAIRTIRRISRNQGVGVLVGGPYFIEHPDVAPLVGADATASDGRHAVMQAESLLAILSRPI